MPTFNSHIDFFFNSVFEDGKDVSSLNSPAEVPVVKALLTSGLLKLVGNCKRLLHWAIHHTEGMVLKKGVGA